jgi:multiple sugar transport system permease protein
VISALKRDYRLRSAYLFLLVPFLLFTLFRNLPLVIAFVISLSKWDVSGFSGYVGFAHYRKILHDPFFRQAFLNTLYYLGATVPLSIGLGLLFAIIIEQRFIRMKFMFRTVFFIPVVCSMVAVATIWNWIYNPMFGLLNHLTSSVGLGRYNWMADSRLAMPAIIAMSVWKSIGYNMIIYIAGLKAISPMYYEAASIDGASRARSFWSITVPLLRPITLFLAIMGVINSFQVFDQVYVLTAGQLRESTIVLVFYLYHAAFAQMNLGYAAAIGYYIFLMILVVTIFQLWIGRKND